MLNLNVSIMTTVMNGIYAKHLILEPNTQLTMTKRKRISPWPSESPPYPPTSPSPPPISIPPDPTLWRGNLPDKPDPTSHINQFTPFKELLHLHYGFLNDADELPISPAVQHISNDKAIHVLGYSKSCVPRLMSTTSYFISLLATGSFQESENVPIPPALLNTIVPNKHFKLSHFFYTQQQRLYILSQVRGCNISDGNLL